MHLATAITRKHGRHGNIPRYRLYELSRYRIAHTPLDLGLSIRFFQDGVAVSFGIINLKMLVWKDKMYFQVTTQADRL